jgi:predicted DNA-binding WGR domain protein
MSEDQRYTRYAEKKAGTNNKFYEVEAIEEDGSVRYFFRWGRIGSKGQEKEHRASNFAYAKSVCDEQFARKLGTKGYREVTAMEALASAIEEVDERKTNGLSPVEIVLPCWGAGESEARLDKFARKWLNKFNLVRASYHDLSNTETNRQFRSVLDGYQSEWKRICLSKAHGQNMTGMVEMEVESFFRKLAREAFVGHVYFYNRVR